MFSTKVKDKSIGKMRSMQLLAVLLVPMVALILGITAPRVWAQGEIAEAEVFFEFNSTDLDLGCDIFLDADPWVMTEVTGPPPGTEVFFIVNTDGGLEMKGNTEIFTESSEPPFCDDPDDPVECTEAKIAAAIAAFQADFPEGTYTFEVWFEDDTLPNAFATAELSHDLPAAPDIRRPKEEQKLKKVKSFKWTDTSEGGDPEIISYEVVAEMVVMVGDEEQTYVNTAVLPGNVKKLTIAPEFLKLAKRAKKRGELVEFKAEVIARGDNLNKTIAEVPVFEFEEEEEEE